MWRERAKLSIAHEALTNSKRPSCFVRGVYPTHLVSGKGAVVTDTNGKKYIDFITGLGCSILGYANDEVNRAIHHRLDQGATLSLGTPLEVECAEKVKELLPWIERARFLKTGSEACAAAVRIARAKTGRQLVISDGYHSWHDEFVSLTRPAIGVNPQEYILKHELISFDDVAAVIIEPVITDYSEERIQYLRDLKRKCTRYGALLIFDEIITGFRWPQFSVSRFYGIEPDIICLGKAVANGLPLSIVAGKKDVMECADYFVSSTFAGETLSLASALKTMQVLQTKVSLQDLWGSGEVFLSKFNALAPELVRIVGYPTRGVFTGDEIAKALFFQESCKAGLLFGPSWFFNFSHIEYIDTVISTCRDILTKIKTGSVRLEGEMPRAPLSQQMRTQ